MNFMANVVICLILVATLFIAVDGAGRENVETCDSSCTMDYYSELKPWIRTLYLQSASRRKSASNHRFISAIEAGVVSKRALLNYFQGMYWHVARSGHLFINLALQRPPAVKEYLSSIGGRIDDGHSSEDAKRATTESLGALLEVLGGDFKQFIAELDTYTPPYEWFLHNAQLRSAIYSSDFTWEIGVAAMNAGTEGVVPYYCGPLAVALEKGYNIKGVALEWLKFRGTEAAKRHGDNGFRVLSHFIDDTNEQKIAQVSLQIDQLSLSMSKTLLDCGSRLMDEENIRIAEEKIMM
jgi:pyrroloquinoline quinone (PQQ) biosynthesis protein C